jgi:hypothetical protein
MEFNNCDPTSELYNFALRYETTSAYDLSKRDIVCLDRYSQDPCKRASCECDRGLASRIFQNGNSWSQDFYHPTGFNFYSQCVDNSHPNFKSSADYSQDEHFDLSDFSARSFTFENGDSLVEQARIQNSVLGIFNGREEVNSSEELEFGGQFETVSDPDQEFQARSSFQVTDQLVKASKEDFQLRCCGDYSDGSRHKFKSTNARSCCGSRTYDNRLFQCCGKDVVSVGTC